MSLTVIRAVTPRSPAHRAGIRVGETVKRVNGKQIVDVLDYKFYTYEPRLEVVLADTNGMERTVKIRKMEGEDLGLDFETYLMDKARSCANNCIFCFVDQLPPGMRKTRPPRRTFGLFSWSARSGRWQATPKRRPWPGRCPAGCC